MSTINNALVVLNYNDEQTTSSFIKMASACDSICRIVVVDNCSTDDSLEKLKSFSNNKIDVIKSERNGGYAYGNNFGCNYAIKKYNPKVIFVSNPDVKFSNSVIDRMQNELMKDEKIGVIAPIVNQGYNIWNLPNFIGVIESLFLIWHNIHKRSIKRKLLKSDKTVEYVGVVEGSFWCVKKDAFIKSGGLDERTFLYYEENIFSRRIRECGYSVAVLPKERYDHFHSVSIKKKFGGKTKAFKFFHTGMKLYMKDYLKCNLFQELVFDLCFALGYVERFLYDVIKRII
jgi:GT2 family glycosyltransferase